jgi:CxxC-x17-CxxC domain-containing protein
MEFQDRPIICLDCKNEFVFTAGEQEFYDRKGFREVPKRCKPCRDSRKAKRDGGGGGGGNGHYGNGNGYGQDDGYSNGNGQRASRGGGGGGGDREMFDAVCASCGAAAQVPFRPQNGRPVYCRDCFHNAKGQGSGYGGGY